MVRLDREQAGFHGCGAAQPPQCTGEPKDELAFHGGLSIVVGDDGGFEGLVVLGIFQRADHGLGGEAVAYRIAAGLFLAFRCDRSGAFAGIAAVGLPLRERGHGFAVAEFGFVSRRGPRLADRARLAGLGLLSVAPVHWCDRSH